MRLAPSICQTGRFYAKYELMNEPVGNAPAKDVKYDPDTYYYCQVYSGDFDCSPWLKARALDVWNPSKLGKVYSTYNYSTTHIMRVPQIYDWIYENKTDYEYLTGGEGAAYVMTASMFKDLKEKRQWEPKEHLRTVTVHITAICGRITIMKSSPSAEGL